MGRYPDGNDTDDNLTDLPISWWATPLAPNVPGQPEDFTRLTMSISGDDELPMDIPDNDAEGIDLTFATPGWMSGTIIDMHLGVNIEHTYRGDLILTLTSPLGTAVTLHDSSGGADDNLQTVYDFATDPAEGTMDDFNGEEVAGTWTLNVVDDGVGDTGQVLEWVFWVDTLAVDM